MVCEQSSRVRSGQAQNEPAGLSQAFLAPEGPGEAQEAQRPSPTLLRPSAHKHHGQLCVARLLSQHPRFRGPEGYRPMYSGPCFPEGTRSCPQLPSGTREHGILSTGRKVVKQTGEDQPGPNPGPALGPRCLGMPPALSRPQFPQTLTSRERDGNWL